MQLREGDRINHYTLVEQLGEGGQGAVWKVIDPRDGGVMRALKLVALAETGPAAFDRARREARILAAARHPALVTCHSLFEEPRDGIVGLVMDLVAGGSLADAIDAGRLDRGRSLAVLAQVADALAYIHGEGLVHRDIKPENLLLAEGFWDDPRRPGTVKLVDFGIAAPAGEATHLTAPGMVIGTLPYLAPELVDPASWGRDQGATRDLFAYGVLACRLLLGKHPTGLSFEASMIDYARAYRAAQAERIPWPPAGLEGRWGSVVGACLSLRRADRPANGAALRERLRDGNVAAPTSTTPHREPMGAADTKTAPMATPPPGAVKTIAAGPIPEAVSVPAPGGAGRVGAAVVVIAGAAVCAAAALAYGSRASPDEATLPLPAPTAAPVSPGPMAPGREDAALGCRKPGMLLDDDARRTVCPVCQGTPRTLEPSHSWQMRLSGITPSEGVERVCAQMNWGPTICARIDVPDGASRLQVTTADLVAGRVYFSARDASKSVVRDASGTKLMGFGRLREGKSVIYETALCSGLFLQIEGTSAVVTVYLDDP